jgi:hypothetical protein
MAGKFSIYKYVKLEGKGWRYARAAYHSNGQLAVSYARQGQNAIVVAQTKSAECISLAGKSQDEQIAVYADAANYGAGANGQHRGSQELASEIAHKKPRQSRLTRSTGNVVCQRKALWRGKCTVGVCRS